MADSRCRRCHRKLKTPEAIEVGFGSVCYKKLFGKPLKQSITGKRYSDCSDRSAVVQEVKGQISIFDLESEVQ